MLFVDTISEIYLTIKILLRSMQRGEKCCKINQMSLKVLISAMCERARAKEIYLMVSYERTQKVM